MAAEEKTFERAIALLDIVSDDGRRRSDGGWEDELWNFSSEAALAQLKRGNRVQMQGSSRPQSPPYAPSYNFLWPGNWQARATAPVRLSF